MVSRLLAGAGAAFLFAGCGTGEAANLAGGHPCPDTRGFTCSTLSVPLDHGGRRPGSLRLAVAAADNVKAPKGVLLLLAGGPGQPGVQIARRVDAIVGAERHAYRVVLYDQRGTGAGALNCPALQAAMGSSDLFPPPAGAVRACAAQLGARRQFFGTDDVVADMESLRKALGARTLAVDGISYGSYVAERYALAHPDRVSKLVLDSVVPHTGETDLGVDEFRATRRVLRDVCGSDRCAADLGAVVRKLDAGPALLDALTFDSIVDPTYVSLFDIPSILAEARAGSTRALLRFLQAARGYQQAPADALDQGLHASALCADWRFPWGDSAVPIAGREAKLARAVAKLPASSLAPFDRRTARDNGFVRQCLPWPPSPATAAPAEGAKIQVPTLLVNGDRDLSTPLEWARKELALAPKARLVVVPGAGHSVQSRATSDAGRSAVAGFLLSR